MVTIKQNKNAVTNENRKSVKITTQAKSVVKYDFNKVTERLRGRDGSLDRF